jgi:phosphate transport system substrate-binding protein
MGTIGRLLCVGAAALCLASPASAGVAAIDPALPAYTPERAVGGNLRSVGSDTMLNLMSLWTGSFEQKHPAVRIQVEGKGSSTAPPALLETQAQFGPMSRAMSDEEKDRFIEKFGYAPTELRVAIDCIAIFVNKDNPLESLTLEQLERVFSVAGPEQMTWGDLGVEDAGWADRPVTLTGRNSASGTYKFFKKHACGDNDFKPTVQENPGSSGVVNAISRDPSAIGYSGIGYRTPDVKLVRIAFEQDEDAFPPDPEYAYSGDYPLARFLYMYLNHDKRVKLDPLREEFVRMIYSKRGQEAVVKDGAYPLTADLSREELRKLGLEPGF